MNRWAARRLGLLLTFGAAGYLAAVVERWSPRVGRKADLFGIGDVGGDSGKPGSVAGAMHLGCSCLRPPAPHPGPARAGATAGRRRGGGDMGLGFGPRSMARPAGGFARWGPGRRGGAGFAEALRYDGASGRGICSLAIRSGQRMTRRAWFRKRALTEAWSVTGETHHEPDSPISPAKMIDVVDVLTCLGDSPTTRLISYSAVRPIRRRANATERPPPPGACPPMPGWSGCSR